MSIRVKAAGHLRQRMPGKQAELSVEPAQAGTVADLLAILGLQESQVWIVRVNGANVQPDHPLAEGDFVELFPLVGGG